MWEKLLRLVQTAKYWEQGLALRFFCHWLATFVFFSTSVGRSQCPDQFLHLQPGLPRTSRSRMRMTRPWWTTSSTRGSTFFRRRKTSKKEKRWRMSLLIWTSVGREFFKVAPGPVHFSRPVCTGSSRSRSFCHSVWYICVPFIIKNREQTVYFRELQDYGTSAIYIWQFIPWSSCLS